MHRISLSFGQSLHFNGMIVTLLSNRKLRVEWFNLNCAPVVLNSGDAAYNYLPNKMIHFHCDEDNTDEECTLTIDNGTYDNVTVCSAWSTLSGMQVECDNDITGKMSLSTRTVREYLVKCALASYVTYIARE